MCTHKERLTAKDKEFLKKGAIKGIPFPLNITPYDCAKCEAEVRMLPKLKLEKPEDGK